MDCLPRLIPGAYSSWSLSGQYLILRGLRSYQGGTMDYTSWWCNNHLEKYEFVNGKDNNSYMKWKINNVNIPSGND